MSNEYIFFYSNYDNVSKLLQDKLIKNYELYKNFHCININNRKLKIPKFITHIPAFLITENGNTQILFEPDASNWLKERSGGVSNEQQAQNGQGSINDWDPSSMSGFSDNFSSLESENGMVKNFSFLGQQEQKINTPESDNNVGGNNSGQQSNNFQQQQGGFSGISSSGFHGGSMSSQMGGGRQIKKTKTEMDFERLMNQRKQEIPQPVHRQ